MSSFEGENMQTQYYVLGYMIDLYFHDKKVAIEIDENEHNDRSIDYKIKNQKAREEKFGWKFIRTDPNKENFDILRAINEKFRHIKQSTKKTLINKTSVRLLRFEFKSEKIIKSKAVNVETYCVSCKKYTANENSSVRKTKKNRLMLLSNCVICDK